MKLGSNQVQAPKRSISDGIKAQLNEIPPSVREPLFRRILTEEDLNYLREGDGILGFQVDLSADQTLSGYTLLGIQKHTIYAYRSEEEPKLILFPDLAKLFDASFSLLDLQVTEVYLPDSRFIGRRRKTGRLRDLVRHLTPPEKDIHIPDTVLAAMVEVMEDQRSQPDLSTPDAVDVSEPSITEQPMEQPNMGFTEAFADPYDSYASYEESYDSYDSYEDYEEGADAFSYADMEEEALDPRRKKLAEASFDSLGDLSDFVVNQLQIPKSIATQLVNKVLASSQVPRERRIAFSVQLFDKLLEDGKV